MMMCFKLPIQINVAIVTIVCSLLLLVSGSGREIPGVRVPAIPIWVHSPYLNWLVPGDLTTDNWVWHVYNNKVSSITAMLRVDSKAYALLGPLETACSDVFNITSLNQLHPAIIYPTRTKAVFYDASIGIELNMTFLQPKFIEDFETYKPFVDVTFDVRNLDPSETRKIEIFIDVAGQHAVDDDSELVSWSRDNNQKFGPHSMKIWHTNATIMRSYTDGAHGGRKPQPTYRFDWGSIHLSEAHFPNSTGVQTSSWIGSSNLARKFFVEEGYLPDTDETVMPVPACRQIDKNTTGICRCSPGGIGSDNDWPAMSLSWSTNLGPLAVPMINSNSKTEDSVVRVGAVISYDAIISGRYLGSDMVEYWKRYGATFDELLENATANIASDVAACEIYDARLLAEMDIASDGLDDYKIIGSLCYRQVLGDNALLWYDGSFKGKTKASPMLLVEGIGSSADTGTIDDNYPASLFFLWGNPKLLDALLRPIHIFMSNETYLPDGSWPRNVSWNKNYSIHFLGQYPDAELQCWPQGPIHCEDMPLEMTADNLQMTAAAALATNDTSTIDLYWPLFKMYGKYLVDNGLDPVLQLCSDDYEGPSAHNANLAAKSIIGIGAFSVMCEMTGRHDEAISYLEIAKRYAKNWTILSAGGRSGASRRTYDQPNSWSQKYNFIWDRVFGFHLFDDAIDKECRFYMGEISKVNTTRQKYGWYLDDTSEKNNLHLTNAGWTEWTAAMCGQEAIEDFYLRLRHFISETPDRFSLTDFYNTLNGKRIAFEGRAQMGGFGATLFLSKHPNGLIASFPQMLSRQFLNAIFQS